MFTSYIILFPLDGQIHSSISHILSHTNACHSSSLPLHLSLLTPSFEACCTIAEPTYILWMNFRAPNFCDTFVEISIDLYFGNVLVCFHCWRFVACSCWSQIHYIDRVSFILSIDRVWENRLALKWLPHSKLFSCRWYSKWRRKKNIHKYLYWRSYSTNRMNENVLHVCFSLLSNEIQFELATSRRLIISRVLWDELKPLQTNKEEQSTVCSIFHPSCDIQMKLKTVCSSKWVNVYKNSMAHELQKSLSNCNSSENIIFISSRQNIDVTTDPIFHGKLMMTFYPFIFSSFCSSWTELWLHCNRHNVGHRYVCVERERNSTHSEDGWKIFQHHWRHHATPGTWNWVRRAWEILQLNQCDLNLWFYFSTFFPLMFSIK